MGLGNTLIGRENVITDLKMWTLLSGYYPLSANSLFSFYTHLTCSFAREYVNSPLELEKSHGARAHGAYAKVQECEDVGLTWTRDHVYLSRLAKDNVAAEGLQIITVLRVGERAAKVRTGVVSNVRFKSMARL